MNIGKEYYRHISSIRDKTLPTKCHNSGKPLIKSYSCVKAPELTSLQQKSIPWHSDFINLINQGVQAGFLYDAIIHGSFGDFSNTNFSDIEVSLFHKNCIYEDKKLIKRYSEWISTDFNRFLLTNDPLQHHSCFFLWPDFLNNYDENILPVSAYENGSWSAKGVTIQFNISTKIDLKATRKRYLDTILRIRNRRQVFFNHGVSPYAIKRLISNLLLLPAFYYQSEGIALSKKDSIIRIQSKNLSEINHTIKLASALRQCWVESPSWLGSLRRKVSKFDLPAGRLDNVITASYRNKFLEYQFNQELELILDSTCEVFENLVENENNKPTQAY